jgi:hypothetical protein
LAASITISPTALVPAVDAVDLDVTLRLQKTESDDEEPRIVMAHVALALLENSNVPEMDLPSTPMVPVNVDVGQATTSPALKVNELSVELAEMTMPGGVTVADAGVAAREASVRPAARSSAPVEVRLRRFMVCLSF